MRTEVSIPDDVFRRAEQLAKKRGTSRSQLYTFALVRLLEAESQDELTRAYDSAFDDDTPDPFTSQAARAVLASIEQPDE